MPRTSRVGMIAAMLAVFSMVLSAVMPMASSAQSSTWSPPSTVYIPETGHTLDRLFLDLWRNAGGANAYGYPITSEITQDNGHVIQYLQYARFEYWPEGDENGNTVLVANLGEELRPITFTRVNASLASTTSSTNSVTALAKQAEAWLPISAPKDAGSDTVYYSETTKHSVRNGFKSYWENTIGTSYLGEPLTEEYTLNGVIYQVFERGQLAWTEENDVWLVPVGQLLADKYKLDQGAVGQGDIPTYSEDLFIEPEPEIVYTQAEGELWLDVNLSAQYMVVYRGDTAVLETYVSTGRPGFDTPTGTFYVNTMLPSQTMEGVLGGEYYNVPDVPDVMYFTDVGHAIHGAYWHNNFGAVMSHGCINLPMDVADWLYAQAFIGMRVEIHY